MTFLRIPTLEKGKADRFISRKNGLRIIRLLQLEDYKENLVIWSTEPDGGSNLSFDFLFPSGHSTLQILRRFREILSSYDRKRRSRDLYSGYGIDMYIYTGKLSGSQFTYTKKYTFYKDDTGQNHLESSNIRDRLNNILYFLEIYQ